MEKNVLRDYLEQIRLLESDVYAIETAIESLNHQYKYMPAKLSAPQKPLIEEPQIPTKSNKLFSAAAIIGSMAVGAGAIGLAYAGWKHYKDKKAEGEYNSALCKNSDAIAIYENKLREHQKYEQEYMLEEERIKTHNYNLSIQIGALENELAATKNTLQKLYDIGVIYKKYRSLIPISMFCEYLDSGIRTELHGANGMYDLYEKQLLGQQIVGELSLINSNLRTISCQLGNISMKLDGIQRNQILLYEEVSRGNAIASRIQKGTEELLTNCEKRLSSIQVAAETSALNSEVTARRTNAIARIAEYEYAADHALHIFP